MGETKKSCSKASVTAVCHACKSFRDETVAVATKCHGSANVPVTTEDQFFE